MLGVRCSAGTRSVRAAQRSVPGRSSRLVPSRWRRSKKYGVTWTPAVHGGARRGLLERAGPAVLGQGQGLAVQDQPVGRERPHHRDHLGQPVGDHVEGPGGDHHVVAVLVHLDPDAVELGVDGHLAAGLGHRGGHVGRAGGEHRQHRPAHLEADLGQRRLALEGSPRDGHRATGEHRRPAYRLQRRSRGGRQTFLDEGVQGALADVAGDHAAQPALLVGGRPAEQVLDRRLARRLRAGAGQTCQLIEGRVHLGDGQARFVGGLRGRADAAPAHARTPLEQRPAEVRDDHLEVLDVRLGERLGEGRHLGLARPGGRDGLRGLHDPGEQHGVIVTRPADKATRAGGEPATGSGFRTVPGSPLPGGDPRRR